MAIYTYFFKYRYLLSWNIENDVTTYIIANCTDISCEGCNNKARVSYNSLRSGLIFYILYEGVERNKFKPGVSLYLVSSEKKILN